MILSFKILVILTIIGLYFLGLFNLRKIELLFKRKDHEQKM